MNFLKKIRRTVLVIKTIQILNYINDVNKELIKQFAALALLLEDGRIVIAYRGTDDSLIGLA